MFFNSNQLSNAQITLANAHDNPISYCWRDSTKYQDFAGNKAPICSSAGSKAIPQMHQKDRFPHLSCGNLLLTGNYLFLIKSYSEASSFFCL